MLKAQWIPYYLQFKQLFRTSRAVMSHKLTYLLKITDEETGIKGYGEIALFQGLSKEDSPDFEQKLNRVCAEINALDIRDIQESSIKFGVETAFADIANGGILQPFFQRNKTWCHEINGLIWMADKETMLNQAKMKIDNGFKCIKLKIGGIDFEKELDILKSLREIYSPSELEIRLDANGAFKPEEALLKLEKLSKYSIHSIEQPIKAGQWENMAEICTQSPIKIALDEELIGVTENTIKNQMLSYIKPHFIILKPSLCGGFSEADDWIANAEKNGIGWWATSALESDIGLNAIGRWLAEKGHLALPQGLGTGQLYLNNIPSTIVLRGTKITTDYNKKWALEGIFA